MAKITITGRVGTEPEVFEKGDRRSCRFRMCESQRPRKDAKEDEKPRDEWFTIWVNHGVDGVMNNIKKGMPVMVTGIFRLNDHTTTDGSKRYVSSDIWADHVAQVVTMETEKIQERGSDVRDEDLPF